MPVIIRGSLEHKIEFMRWGLIPSWAKDEKIGYKLINAREETLLEKSTWKRLVKSKRCIIPARGFYEWKKLPDGTKNRLTEVITAMNIILIPVVGKYLVQHPIADQCRTQIITPKKYIDTVGN